MGHGQQKRPKLQNHIFEKIEKKDFDPKTWKLHIISIFMTKIRGYFNNNNNNNNNNIKKNNK